MKHFLRHYLLPHESNNHRAKLLHHQTLVLLVATVVLTTFFLQTMPKGYKAVLGISANISVTDLLSITNQKRQENGLSPLQINPQLSVAAGEKADYMFAHNFWAHVAPDGTTPWYFIKNSGYEYLYAGENLARGFDTAPDVVDAWMNSPSHRDNMLSPNYNDIGFSVKSGSLTGTDTVLVVEMFGTKYIADVPSPSVTPKVEAGVVQPLAPSPTLILPSVTQSVTLPKSKAEVAAINNQPLVDGTGITKQLVIFLLVLFISVLIIDTIIIERKKIVRVVAHNLDHMIFLIVILIAVFIVGRGFIA